jgi:hypothetical protein
MHSPARSWKSQIFNHYPAACSAPHLASGDRTRGSFVVHTPVVSILRTTLRGGVADRRIARASAAPRTVRLCACLEWVYHTFG